MTFFKRSMQTTIVCLSLIGFHACKDDHEKLSPLVPGDTIITPPVEPAIANTMGFFADDWEPKDFVTPAFVETSASEATNTKVIVDASSIITKIPLSEFGHNAVWWMGTVSTEAVTNIANLHPHIIRFPGGNSSNNYFWNKAQDELPDDVPSTYIDKDGKKLPAGYNYGKTNHDWELSLDKYYALLQQTGNQGLISVNYSYARYSTAADPVASAAHLAADWVRHDNGRTQYWELGNENYGDWQAGYRIDLSLNKDDQPEFITGELYGNHAKVFIDSMQKAAGEIGHKIYIGAVIHESPATESWQTATTKTWNAGMIPALDDKADFYVVHNYFTGTENVSSAGVLSAALAVPAKMMKYVTEDLVTYGAAIKPLAFDEWNMFAEGSKQQVSSTSGVFAVIVMGELLRNKFGMAARWDLLNGWSGGNDHGLFSAGDEPGIPKWQPRPSFYYLYYFQKLLGDRLVSTTLEGNPAIVSYGSTFSSGQMNVTLVNTGATSQAVEVTTKNFRMGARYYWFTLEGGADNADFSRKVLVNGKGPVNEAGGPADYKNVQARSALTANGIVVTLPARSVVVMAIDKK